MSKMKRLKRLWNLMNILGLEFMQFEAIGQTHDPRAKCIIGKIYRLQCLTNKA